MKFFVKTLVIILLLSLFTACGAQSGPEEVPEFDLGTDGEMNLEGYHFIFYALEDFETFFKPDVGYSATGDSILSRYDEVSAKLNTEIEVIKHADDIMTYIVSNAAAGLKYADLVDTGARNIYQNKQYFHALNELEGFDITSDKWGPQNYLDTTKFGGKNYGFIAGYWGMPYPQYIGNLYFIKDTLSENSLDNPQEFYENGTWTWDVFRDYCRKAIYTDPADSSNNIYGFVVSDELKLPKAWIISNGGNAIEFDEETQRYYFALDSANSTEALQYLRDMMEEGLGYYTTGDAWEQAAIMFKEHKTIFYEAFNKHSFVNADNHLASPTDFPDGHSWVPYPCGPRGTYGASTAQFWFTARFLAMVNNFDDFSREAATIIVNEIFEPLDGQTKDSWKEAIERSFFFDAESFKYYVELFEGGHPDYSTVAYNAVWTTIPIAFRTIIRGTSGVSEAINTIKDTCQADIDATLNADLEAAALGN